MTLRLSHKSIAITDRSSIGEARRFALQVAKDLGFNESRCNDIAIVATEMATNTFVHAERGELLICPSTQKGTIWLDLLAIDSGPGILDIASAMEDGFSTRGTAGQGLGAIRRLSNETSLYSIPLKGTVHWSRFVNGQTLPMLNVGILNVPVHGETRCGDGVLIENGPSRSLYIVVDGLGHGDEAAEAADEAIATVSRFSHESLTEMISRSHDALRKTRGAAMSIAAVDHDRSIVTYAGIGNIGASLITGSSSRSLMCQNGTVGAVMPRSPQEYTYPITQNTTLLMFSDGLSTKTSIAGYPGLHNRHPALIAGVAYRDFAKKRDDATVLFAPIGGNVS